MVKSPIKKIQFTDNCTLGIADILLVYSMLSPIIFLIIGEHIILVPNFFRTLIILLGPGLVAGAIYFRIFGIQSFKRSKWIIYCMIGFVLVIFLSSIKNIDTGLTRDSLRFFISYCLFGFAIGTLSNMTPARSRRFNSIWLIFIVGFLIYSIYEHWPIVNQRIFNSNKSINNAQIGSLFYFFALCGLFQLQFLADLKTKTIVLFILSTCLIIGFYAGNRTAFLGFLISFVIFLFYYSHIKLKKNYPIILACFLIAISLVLLPHVNKSIKTRYVRVFEDAKNITGNLVSNNPSKSDVNIRFRIWQDAMNKFKQDPVLGSGFGISYHDKISGKTWVHPHNIIIEILAELGLVGFCIFFILFGLIIAKIFLTFKKTSGTDRLTFFFYPLSLLFFFIYSSLHADLSTEYFKWYFAGIIAGFDTAG